MNYPLISEYIEAIKSAEDNFKKLRYLRPVLGDNELPVMSAGSFSVVFKMKDEREGKFYAVKCFTKEQEGRTEAYREIAKELKDVSSPYLVSIRYLEKELFVETDQTTEAEFPVLLMDWVEGIPMNTYISSIIDNQKKLEDLTYQFSKLSSWLLSQPFAHGNLQPDNILIKGNGLITLIDYDNMFVPTMRGQKAREKGNPNYCHPQQTAKEFHESMDCFTISLIILSLKVITIEPCYMKWYGGWNHMLLEKKDFEDLTNSACVQGIKQLLSNKEIMESFGLFLMSLSNRMHIFDSSLIDNIHRNWLDGYNENDWIYPYKDKTICVSNELLNNFSLEDVEIGIVDSVYETKVKNIIQNLYLSVDLYPNTEYIDIFCFLLCSNYGSYYELNIEVRKAWLSSPSNYYLEICGHKHSVDSNRGYWEVFYNETQEPNKIHKFCYESDNLYDIGIAVDISYDIFKRMHIVSRFLKFGEKAIQLVKEGNMLKYWGNGFGLVIDEPYDCELPV